MEVPPPAEEPPTRPAPISDPPDERPAPSIDPPAFPDPDFEPKPEIMSAQLDHFLRETRGTYPMSSLLSPLAMPSDWVCTLHDSFDEAELALQSLVELAVRVCENGRDFLALGPSLSAAVDKLEKHYETVDTGRPSLTRATDAMTQNLTSFWSHQVRNLDHLLLHVRTAPNRDTAAQAILVTAVVMLGDWHAHGRLLTNITRRHASLLS